VRATVRIDDLFATLLSLSYHRNNATAAAPPQQRGKGSGKDAEEDDDDKDDAAAWGAWLARMRAAAPNSRPLFNALSSDQHRRHAHYLHRAGPAPLAGASQQASEESSRPAALSTAGEDHRRDRPQGPAASGPQVQGGSVRWHELGGHSAAVQRGRFKLVASLAVVGDHTPARFVISVLIGACFQGVSFLVLFSRPRLFALLIWCVDASHGGYSRPPRRRTSLFKAAADAAAPGARTVHRAL
jgi:hypothetical protein